jgi:hypothetical protein
MDGLNNRLNSILNQKYLSNIDRKEYDDVCKKGTNLQILNALLDLTRKITHHLCIIIGTLEMINQSCLIDLIKHLKIDRNTVISLGNDADRLMFEYLKI